ncbi:hypothetical protein Tco_0614868 [Tanacetum coccineum]
MKFHRCMGNVFKGLLRQCPHHGFSKLHQLDTFYNSLNTNNQDGLDFAAGGNFLDKMPRDGLAIIESKSKVRYSRSRANDSKVSTNAPPSTSSPSISFELQQIAASLEDKMDIRMSRLEKAISEKQLTPATVKAVEERASDQAYENSLIYKEKTKKLHDSKIKNRIFNVGDQVLLFNSRLKIFSGKLKSRWSGPFTITEVYPYGTAKLSHADGSNFKVNCHRLKHYYGGDTPPLVIPDLQTFPKDN